MHINDSSNPIHAGSARAIPTAESARHQDLAVVRASRIVRDVECLDTGLLDLGCQPNETIDQAQDLGTLSQPVRFWARSATVPPGPRTSPGSDFEPGPILTASIWT